MADLNRLNDSELRVLVRAMGWRIAYFTSRQVLEDILNGREPPEQPSLVEWRRYEIMDWTAKHWEDIFFQVGCPLQVDGCVVCPDFTVVSCLVHNRHIFNLEKEAQIMSMSWTAMLVSLTKSDRAQASSILREAAKEAPAEGNANRVALMKVAMAVFDLANGVPPKPVTFYMGLRKETCTPDAVGLVEDKSATLGSILQSLADLLDSGSGPAKTEKPAEEKKTEGKKGEGKKDESYYPAVTDAGHVSGKASGSDDDDDDDDDDEPPKTAETSAPLPPQQDATQFAKKGKGKGTPKAEEKPVPPTPSELKEIAKEPSPPLSVPQAELIQQIRLAVRSEFEGALAKLGELLARVYGSTETAPVIEPKKAPAAEPKKGKDTPDTIPEMDGDDDDD
jgi:hypothetical protein